MVATTHLGHVRIACRPGTEPLRASELGAVIAAVPGQVAQVDVVALRAADSESGESLNRAPNGWSPPHTRAMLACVTRTSQSEQASSAPSSTVPRQVAVEVVAAVVVAEVVTGRIGDGGLDGGGDGGLGALRAAAFPHRRVVVLRAGRVVASQLSLYFV